MQIEKIQVRSPMTCEASLGVCRCCYGMDLATGQLVEVGMAVGIIAAQSIGEPGTQLTMRTFHIGGVATRGVEEKDVKCKREGKVKFVGLNIVINDEGKSIALSRNGEIQILDAKGRKLEKYDVPDGAIMLVEDGQTVNRSQMLCEWDPHNIPILAEVGGKVRFDDIVEGETMKIEIDPPVTSAHDHRAQGRPAPAGHHRRCRGQDTRLQVHPRASEHRSRGRPDDLGRNTAGQDPSRGGRHPGHHRGPAASHRNVRGPQAQGAGRHRRNRRHASSCSTKNARGKRTIIVRNESGIEREHLVPHGKYLRVHGGDRVRAGDPLVDGPLVPHDILRISGEEAVQQYLLREIQNVYRSQHVEIDDKHMEIIIAQMLRKVRVESVGDTGLLPGSVIDKFEFRRGQPGPDDSA